MTERLSRHSLTVNDYISQNESTLEEEQEAKSVGLTCTRGRHGALLPHPHAVSHWRAVRWGSRVLFSHVFGPEDTVVSAPDRDLGPEERRLLQKEKLAVVARCRVHVPCCVRLQGRPATEVGLGEELVALQEAESGVLRLATGDPFPREHSVLWLAVQALSFTLVCEPHENLLLAEGTLRSLARHCLENLRMLGPGSEVLLKSDRIEALLHRLLPHGQLLFLNHRFTQSLEKELAAYMAK